MVLACLKAYRKVLSFIKAIAIKARISLRGSPQAFKKPVGRLSNPGVFYRLIELIASSISLAVTLLLTSILSHTLSFSH